MTEAHSLTTAAPGLAAWVWPAREPDRGSWVIGIGDLTANRFHWDLTATAIAGRFGFASFDLRGRADSLELGPTSSAAAHVADVFTVADSVATERVVLIGHGYGASIAMLAATTTPSRVAAIIAIDGPVAASGEPSAIGAMLDPSIARIGRTFPHRDTYLQFWQTQGWYAAGGVDRGARHALLADLSGSGFGWQVRLSPRAVNGDIANRPEFSVGSADSVMDQSVVLRTRHGHSPDEPGLDLEPLGITDVRTVEGCHGGALLQSSSAAAVAEVICEVVPAC